MNQQLKTYVYKLPVLSGFILRCKQCKRLSFPRESPHQKVRLVRFVARIPPLYPFVFLFLLVFLNSNTLLFLEQGLHRFLQLHLPESPVYQQNGPGSYPSNTGGHYLTSGH